MSLRVFLGFSVALMLVGCDTPGTRAHCHPGAFGKLSPADRRLILSGRVHAGMDATAVYIAWGEPDSKRPSGDGKAPSETWLYRRQLTLKTPMDSFDRWSPGNHVFGQVVPLVVNSGLGFGGVGNEGVTLYQPHLVFSDDTVRRAVFEDGRLASYEEFQAGDDPVH